MLGFAVVGPGRAGRARIAALADCAKARLVATVSRQGEPTLDQALADPRVDAVMVCTPNAQHADQVRRALDAGKHVAVEFPLAPGAEAARSLFERAQAGSRVLHVEHIELLSASQRRQRERVRGLGRPKGGELCFSGANAGWIGDDSQAGSAALRALARLHRLVDLFGAASAVSASLERGAAGYELRVELEFESGGCVRLVERRGAGLERATRWSIECEGGTLDDPEPAPERGLFREDLDCFLARIASGADPYVADERVVGVLELVGAIERACA